MEAITYTQVQQLVEKLPEAKLPLVYHFLLEGEVSPQMMRTIVIAIAAVIQY